MQSVGLTVPRLKGGFQYNEFIKYQLKSRILLFSRVSPFTLSLLAISIATTSLTLFGFMKPRRLLFNQRMVSRGQIYRVLSGLLVLGLNLFDVGKRIYGMYKYQGELETLYTTGNLYNDDQLPTTEKVEDEEDNELGVLDNLKTRISPRFAKTMILMTALSIVPHLVYFQPLGRKLYFYSLYPIVEQSVRWLWALTVDENKGIEIGMITLSPLVLPVLLSVYDGVGNFGMVVHGFINALITSYVMRTRRFDGKFVKDWIQKNVRVFWTILVK